MKKKNSKLTGLRKTKLRYRLWMYFALISMIIYIIWRTFFTIPSIEKYGIIAFICGVMLILAETISAIEALVHYRNMDNIIIPDRPIISLDMYPDVDVLIATHNEDVDLLYKTVNGCKHMKYPFKDKVHIYICDDMQRPAMRELAKRMEVGYFTIEDNKHAKSGNLNNALKQTFSPYVATFDADMIPTSDFLLETVPYMFLPYMKQDENGDWIKKEEDEIDTDFKMGFIQTPQSFYNPDLFQFNFYSENRIPNEQDYFFKEINVGRNRTNSPIYAGSNTLISREALEAVDYIAINTITEDFETGIKIQSKGFTCIATDRVVAHGLSPTDFPSLIKQRERWGRGCIASVRHFNLFFNKGLSIRGKLSYLSAYLYWFTFVRRFIYIISPILFVLFGIPVVICGWRGLLFIWLPSYLLYNHALKLSSGRIRTFKWSNVFDTVIFPYLIIPILAEFFMISQKKFNVTDKSRKNDNKNLLLGIPHLILFCLNTLAIIVSVMNLVLYNNVAGIIIIYWLLVNDYNLLMALFFVYGRKNLRNNDRFKVEIPIKLLKDDKAYNGVTYDISDNGLAVLFDNPIYIDQNETVTIELKYRDYTAEILCQVAHATKRQEKWFYGLRIVEMDEKNKAEYFEIVYDRHHTMADYTEFTFGVADDILINLRQRSRKNTESVRKYPRIIVNKYFHTSIGKTVQLIDINYKFVKLHDYVGENLDLFLDDDLILNLHSVKQTNIDRVGLYEVLNIDILSRNSKFNALIDQWSQN